jgi:hypothetical protein
VQLRDVLAASRELAHRLDDLEKHVAGKISSQDAAIADILSAIRQLVSPPTPHRLKIGFISDPEGAV